MIKKYCLLKITLLLTILSSSVSLAAFNRPIMVAHDRQISAFIEGEKCADGVKITFKAKNETEFDRRTGKAARFIGNITDLLKSQCPIIERVSVRGVVKGDILYTGVAAADTDWVVTELGSRSGSSILSNSGSNGSRNGKTTFLNASDFVDASSVIKTPQIECIDFKEKTNSCLVQNYYSFDKNSIHIKSEYLLNKQKAIAAISYKAELKSGFLCADPSKMSVDVIGGKMNSKSREDMKELLVERLNAVDKEVCSGFKGTFPNLLITQSFGTDGSSLAPEQSSTFSSSQFDLRIED